LPKGPPAGGAEIAEAHVALPQLHAEGIQRVVAAARRQGQVQARQPVAFRLAQGGFRLLDLGTADGQVRVLGQGQIDTLLVFELLRPDGGGHRENRGQKHRPP
jgi:hypothetical protein